MAFWYWGVSPYRDPFQPEGHTRMAFWCDLLLWPSGEAFWCGGLLLWPSGWKGVSVRRDPPQMATVADGTHPTGMHSCLWSLFQVKIDLEIKPAIQFCSVTHSSHTRTLSSFSIAYYMPAACLQKISCRSCSQTTYMAIDYLGLQHHLWVYYNWECVMCNCCCCVSAELNSHFIVRPVGVQHHGELSRVWCFSRYYWLLGIFLLLIRLWNDNNCDCTYVCSLTGGNSGINTLR